MAVMKSRWRVPAFVIATLVVACSSSYTDDPAPAADAGATSSASSASSSTGGASSSSSSTSSSSSSGTTNDDAGSTTFGLACPKCSADETCYAGGCDGLDSATCTVPQAIGEGTYTVYVCAKAPKAQSCAAAADGGAAVRVQEIAAAFSLGAGTWKIAATGSTPRITVGSCAQWKTCNGGSATALLDNVVGPTTLTVSTGSPNAACQQFVISVKKL